MCELYWVRRGAKTSEEMWILQRSGDLEMRVWWCDEAQEELRDSDVDPLRIVRRCITRPRKREDLY